MTPPQKPTSPAQAELNIGQIVKGITSNQSEINVGEVAQKTTSPSEIWPAGVITSLMNRASIEKEESSSEQQHRLWRETIENVTVTIMKVAGFAVLVAALVQSTEVLKDKSADPSTKKLAENTIALVIGAVAGFSVGKGQKK